MRFRPLYITLGAFIISGFLNGYSETVSQKEASKVAQIFFNAANGQVMAKPTLVYNGRGLTTDRLFSPFYIYNHPKGGFVIISAENKAFPILGYSLKDNFSPDNMPASIKALLEEYATDIELIRYDDRKTPEAADAWINLPEYISGILSSIYSATDPGLTIEEAREIVENYETSGRLEDISSDLYTPQQWRDFVDEELEENGSFPLAIISDSKLEPVVIHGKKGDFYRIFAGEYNDWLLRLMPTEYLSYGQVADFGNTLPELLEEEEPPFLAFEEFLASSRNESTRRLDSSSLGGEAIIRNVGGGRYEITLPENALMARVYNLSGSKVKQIQYSGSPVASVSLEGLPYGFYIIVVNGESGQPYEYKLSR